MKILIIHTMAIDYNGVTDCIVQYLKHMNREGMEAYDPFHGNSTS